MEPTRARWNLDSGKRMKIERIAQVPADSLSAIHYDVALVASGYESRARTVAESLGPGVADRKIAWAFVEQASSEVRVQNDDVLTRLGYDLVLLSEGSSEDAARFFCQALTNGGSRRRVLIDISSMTRAWYGGMVKALSQLQYPEPITTRFAYTPAEYMPPPPQYPPNEVLRPIPGFSSLSLPDKPTALILGLGHDPERALGLKDHLDPQMTLLFRADPGIDPRYGESVLTANRDLIDMVGRDHLFSYPLGDCVTTYKIVESACRGLLRDWRLVICSLGPKLFGLVSFLLATYYEEISIWRVSACAKHQPFDHKPGGAPIVFEIGWCLSTSEIAEKWYPVERGIE